MTRLHLPKLLLTASLIAAISAFALAESADKADKKDPQKTGGKNKESMPEVWRTMTVPPAAPKSPEEELATFKIAPGFHAQLVASEPMIESPIAMTWDGSGRLWVVEMRGYMPDSEGHGEDKPVGRVSVLEDTDGDGKMDKTTVFLDGLVMPRAIAIVDGGVLIGEPPNLWFCTVTPDLKCGKKTSVFNRYGQQGPVEHTDNGLMRGLDNWLYNAKSLLRLQLKDGKIITSPTVFRGQWGITQDDYGRIYTNSNSSFLHADFFPAQYLLRNPSYYSSTGLNASLVKSQECFSIRVNPGVNRGYKKETLRADGRLANCTATCGPGVYRGDQFPAEFRGNVFVPEPSANVIVRFVTKDTGDGISLTTDHITYEDDTWGKREFLASTDERFRPVNTYTGPDGCLYVIDMYRGILQHRIYVTPFLRKQILERHLDVPVNQGRIWRIVADAGTKPNFTAVALDKAPTDKLIADLSSPNGWTRDTAQRLLVQRNDSASVPALRKLAATGDSALGRIHALFTLSGVAAVDLPTVAAALTHDDPQVRIAALRNADVLIKNDPNNAIKVIAPATNDPNSAVQLQALNTLGEAPPSIAASEAIAEAAVRRAASKMFRDAAISGSPGRTIDLLQHVLAHTANPTANSGETDLLRDIASATFAERRADACAALLEIVAHQTTDRSWRQVALLSGIANYSKNPRPIMLAQEPKALAMIQASKDSAVRKAAGKAVEVITWPGDKSKPNLVPVPELTEAQKAMYEKGREIYSQTCFGCHQPNGRGLAGLAPPLLDSPYILGPDARLARIILNGLAGKVTIDKTEWDLVMPGFSVHPLFTDEGVAAVMTYVHREWGHTGSPVDTATVKKVRDEIGQRFEPWTIEELKKIK